MLRNSKSIFVIVILAVISLVTFGTAAALLERMQVTEFENDGYILTAESQEAGVVSSQIWFGKGVTWASADGVVTFADVSGNEISAEEDSFIHYEGEQISAVKDTAVMNLDDFVNSYIRYYQLGSGVLISDEGDYYSILGENEVTSFENYLIKSSSSSYLLGSHTIRLVWKGDGTEIESNTGFLEVRYLTDDRSIVLLNDGKNAWQVLSSDGYIELENGVRFILSTATLEGANNYAADEVPVFDLADLTVDVNLNVDFYSGTTYPTYRFTVINGEDGTDGTVGENGADGEPGEIGESGDAGENGQYAEDGAVGALGTSGTSGGSASEGDEGALGGSMSIIPSTPEVQITEWSINGRGLKFTVYMDPDSTDTIVEGTSNILLEDLDSGKTYEWSTTENEEGQSIEFAEDASSGTELSYDGIVPGHTYRLTISADYTIDEVRYSKALLVRKFTADDYGISFDMTDIDSKSVTYTITRSNTNVKFDESNLITVTINGDDYPETFEIDRSDDSTEITIDFEYFMTGYKTGENSYANQSWDIEIKLPVTTWTYSSTDKQATQLTETITYLDTVVTRKAKPVFGGVKLLEYNTGYLVAEACGTYDTAEEDYGEVVDYDDTVEAIRFELYEGVKLNYGSSGKKVPYATQTVKNGYIAYFSMDKNDIREDTDYYVIAYYLYSDGVVETEEPILETYDSTDSVREAHPAGKTAWDTTKLTSVTVNSVRFDGTTDNSESPIYNTAADQTAEGISYNRIKGTLYVKPAVNNLYISDESRIEVQVSAAPDYFYKELTYGSQVDNVLQSTGVTHPQAITLNAASEFQIPVDLTGLKADRTYMFTVYGYEYYGSNPVEVQDSDLTRVVIGSVAITTADEKNIEVSLIYEDDMGMGCNILLGASEDAENLYNSQNTKKYYTETDASYRGLAQITLGLYKVGQSDPIGTCVLTDTLSTNGATTEYNSLYEKYYGTAYKDRVNELESSGKTAMIGVGSEYTYRFRKADNTDLELSDLTYGDYYIAVVSAYDYTYTRYQYETTTGQSTGTSLYDYYSYHSAMDEYVNLLDVNGGEGARTDTITKVNLPFKTPDELKYEDNTYIKVETLTNENLGAYNGDDTQNALYCTSLNADTVVGFKLSSKYVNQYIPSDNPDEDELSQKERGTDSFVYYGFNYSSYRESYNNETTLNDASSPAFRTSIDMVAGGYIQVPDVYVLFYDSGEESLKGIENLTPIDGSAEDAGDGAGDGAGSEESTELGYLYRTTAKDKSGNTILIYYLDSEKFSRGHSYYFSYEANLSNYKLSDDEDGYSFPKDYYGEDEYTFSNSLKSGAARANRQAPVAYASLVQTTTQTLTDTGASTKVGEDQWNVYVSDPDGAILSKTLVHASNAMAGTSTTTEQGGLKGYDGSALRSDQVTVTVTRGEGEDKVLLATGDETSTFNALYANSILSRSAEHGVTEEYLKSFISALECYPQAASEDETIPALDNAIQQVGATVWVSNLPAEGLYYDLSVEYRVQDDGYNSSPYSNLQILAHNYVGAQKLDKNSLKFAVDSTNNDHNTILIYLEEEGAESATSPAYLTQSYINKVANIAGVKVKAYNKTQQKYINKRKSDGKEDTDTPMELWVSPTAPGDKNSAQTDYRYYLDFKLNDLDEKSLQFNTRDEIYFELEVYYVTGESVQMSTQDDMTGDVYALRKVAKTSAANPLYADSTGEIVYFGEYLYTDGTYYGASESAGGSMLQIKPTVTGGETIPWHQKVTVKSPYFNYGYSATIANLDLYGSADASVEALVLDHFAYTQSDNIFVTVQDRVPIFTDVKTIGGLSTINLTATVKNVTLVSYPEDEELHFYYLISRKNSEGQYELVAAMVGEGDNYSLLEKDGALNLNLSLETNSDYRIAIYYKQTNSALKTDHRVGLDGFTSGRLYTNETYSGSDSQYAGQTMPEALKNILETAKDDSGTDVFRLVSGLPNGSGTYIAASTSAGIRLGNLTMDMHETASYFEKNVSATVNVLDTIVAEESESLSIMYRMEACQVDADIDDEENWSIVVMDGNDPNYSTYKDQDTVSTWSDAKRSNLGYGQNTFYSPYYSGGTIKPGYYYRLKALIVQRQESSNGEIIYKNVTNVTNADTTDQTVVCSSDYITCWDTWENSVEFDFAPHVLNVVASADTLSMNIHFSDYNNTSVDGKYFLRLAKATTADNGTVSWEVLENSESDSAKYPNGSLYNYYEFDETYTVSFTNLDSDTTYRLQVYALMDTDFDNNANLTVLELADRGEYLTKNDYFREGQTVWYTGSGSMADNLEILYKTIFGQSNPFSGTVTPGNWKNFEKIQDTDGDVSSLVTVQSVGTTLLKGQTSSLGELDETGRDGNQLTLTFNGAYNAQEVTQISYSLGRYYLDDNNLPVQDRTWDVVTIDKQTAESGTGAGAKNLFTENEGTTSVTITLGSDVIESGMKYRMQIRFLNAEGTIIYENTVAFE